MERTLTSKLSILAITVCLLTVTAPGAVAPSEADSDCAVLEPAEETTLQDQLDGAGPVICLDGEFRLDDGLVLDDGGVTLTAAEDAEEATVSLRTSANAGTATINVQADGVTVSDLTIERNADDPRSGQDNPNFAQAVRVAASDVTIADNVVTAGSNLDGANNAGIMALDGHGNDPTSIESVTITGNDVSGFAYGVGVAAAYDSGVSVSDVAIDGNTITDNQEAGIALADGIALAALGLPEEEITGEEPRIEDVQAHENILERNELAILNAAATLLDARQNHYGSPAGPAPSQPIVGAVIFAPWCVDEGCATVSDTLGDLGDGLDDAEESLSQQLVEIENPEVGAAFGPGADVTVEWTTPASDFFLQQVFSVELRDADSHEVVEDTKDYTCAPTDVGEITCEATLANVDEGDWIVSVRPTLSQDDTLSEVSMRVCAATATANIPSTCDSVPISTGDITTVDEVRPADATEGWVNTAVEVDISCLSTLETCEIRYDSHAFAETPGPFQVVDDQVTATVDQEGERNVTWFGIDQNGNQEADKDLPFQIDLTDPVTDLTLLGTEGNDGWFTSAVDADVTANDDLSGVADTTVQPAFPIDTEGVTTVEYGSEDVAGNVEDTQTVDVQIDTAPPETTSSFDGTPGDGDWFVSPVQVTLDPQDDTSGVAETVYTLDGTDAVYEGPFEVSEDGEHTLSYRSIDVAGNDETATTEPLKIDATDPTTEIGLTGQSGDNGWFVGPVDVDFTATDANSGVATTEYRLDGAQSWTEDDDSLQISDEGTTTIEYRSTDGAGNVEDVRTETVEIDTVAPTTTAQLAGDQEQDVYVTPVEVTLDGQDDSSGLAATEYRLNGGAWTTYDGTFEVVDDGQHTLEYRSTDVAGNDEQDPGQTTFEIDKPAVLELDRKSHDTFVPNGDDVELVFEATWIEGENAGEPADGEAVVIRDANSDFQQMAETNADGLASFTLSEQDIQREVHATIEDPSGGADVVDPSPATITWTDIAIDRVAGEDVTDADPGWANVGDTYRVAYQVTTTWNDQPLEGATVKLDNGAFTSTDENGIARVPTSSESLTETTFAATASYNPSDGPEQTVAASEDATVKWAKVVYENLSPNPADATHWHDAGTDRSFSFEAYVDYGDARIPAENAQVEIAADSLTSDADATTQVTVASDGTAEAILGFADNAQTEPVLHLASTEQGISVDEDAGFGDQRWATLVVDDLSVSSASDYADGWHAVGDTVTFGFQADLVFGDDRASHSTPAEGTELTFSLKDDETVIVGQDGSENVAKTMTEAFESTPQITHVSSPEGIQATEIVDIGTQRWTELELTATPDDGFVNVGDEVEFALEANWTHDDSPVSDTEVVISFEGTSTSGGGGGGGAKVCDPFTGSGTCSISRDVVYADNLTFSVNSTEVGITQQTDGEPTEVPMVWTEIQVSDLAVDDGFVDVGDTISMNGTVDYAHLNDTGEHPTVSSATLALADDAPAGSCTLDRGDVTDGRLVANVTCSDVVDDRIPLVVSANDQDVTRLAQPLELHDVDRDENAVWTGFDVAYETTDEDGQPISDGTLLDNEEPVRFQGTVQFAHIANAEDATMPPSSSVEFQVLNEDDSLETNCIGQIDAETGEATCVTEVREEKGLHNFSVGAASFDKGDDGLFERDVTDVRNDPDDVSFRWTWIAFEAFQCEGDVSAHDDCGQAFQAGDQVTVTVTAIAADTGAPLENATITIDGNQKTTTEDGTASQKFIHFEETCRDVTASGVDAMIDGQEVTWDVPRTQTICWQ